jgi:hypothetical protein
MNKRESEMKKKYIYEYNHLKFFCLKEAKTTLIFSLKFINQLNKKLNYMIFKL